MAQRLTQKDSPHLKLFSAGTIVMLILASIFAVNHQTHSRTENGLVVYYDFSEGQGDTIHDKSGREKPIDLLITEPSAVKWLEGFGLSIQSGTVIHSIDHEKELKDAIKDSEAITIEAWLKPASSSQSGPARIVSFSKNSLERNFTLGQDGKQYIVRMRTGDTNDNGMPNASSSNNQVSHNYIQHLVYTWNGETNKEFIYVDGVRVYSGNRSGEPDNWKDSFHLLLGNEATGDRSWLGELYQVAIYDKVLSKNKIQEHFEAEFVNGDLPLGDYGLGKKIDTYYQGINNSIPVSLTIPDPNTIDSMIVELAYKANIGSTLSFNDAEGNTFTANREQIGGVYVYRRSIPPTSQITYSNTSNQSSAQSIIAYAYRSGNENLMSDLFVSDVGGHNSVETFGAKIPPTFEARDIHLVLPITELTYDNRVLSFTARAGTVDTSFTVKWGSNGRGFPKGCCLDFVEIDLLNVAGHVAQVVISVESPGSGLGQSYALSGIMTLEISPSAGGTFPLEWLGVDAAWEGTKARINWATYAEENTDFFEIERATAGQDFVTIGRIAARGSIDTETSYDFLDQEAGRYDEIYYRIRQVDLNGAFTMSDQMVLMSNKLDEINMRIGPNPTQGPVNISLEGAPQTEMAYLQLMDLNGRILKEETLTPGQKTANFDLSAFSEGLYIVRYMNGEHVINKRIQKK